MGTIETKPDGRERTSETKWYDLGWKIRENMAWTEL